MLSVDMFSLGDVSEDELTRGVWGASDTVSRHDPFHIERLGLAGYCRPESSDFIGTVVLPLLADNSHPGRRADHCKS